MKMADYVICSECFSNYGLKKTASQIGKKIDLECPLCHSKEGYMLNMSSVKDLIDKFFIEGGRPTNYFPSPYQQRCANSGFEIEGIIEKTAWNDYKLLKHVTNTEITESGHVKTYIVGGDFYSTSFYGSSNEQSIISEALSNGDISSKKRKGKIENIIHSIPQRAIKIFETLTSYFPVVSLTSADRMFRCRHNATGIWKVEYWKDFETCPKKYRVGNRFNDLASPMFYASMSSEYALLEIRPRPDSLINHEIYVGIISPTKALSLLDMSFMDSDAIKDDDFPEDLYYFWMSLFYTLDDYIVTQLLSKYIKDILNLDGILFPSALRYINHGDRQKAINLGIFGYPLKERKLILESANKVFVDNILAAVTYGALT